MENITIQNAVKDIHLSSITKRGIVKNVRAELWGNCSRAKWHRPAAVVAAVLCLVLLTPVRAAASTSIYDLMYALSPAIAQQFQPVQLADEDNGIRMEVVSASIRGDTAQVYLTLRDLTGDRVDGTVDLFDSYRINRPFDSTGRCEFVAYDDETGTATLLVTIRTMDGSGIGGGKVTFSFRQFLSRKTHYEDVEIPCDLGNIRETATGWPESWSYSGGGLSEREPMLPGQPYVGFPVEGISLTGIGLVDGALRVQTAVENYLENDNHGRLWLTDSRGGRIESGSTQFIAEKDGRRLDYVEYVFPSTPEALAEYRLHGEFWTSGLLTTGNWSVTFPLEEME